jgi:acyl carrier protein
VVGSKTEIEGLRTRREEEAEMVNEATSDRRQRIIEIFSEVMGVDPAEVSDQTAYELFEPWDSLKHMEMVARFEEEFGVDLEIDDVIDMSDLGKINEILDGYLRSGG